MYYSLDRLLVCLAIRCNVVNCHFACSAGATYPVQLAAKPANLRPDDNPNEELRAWVNEEMATHHGRRLALYEEDFALSAGMLGLAPSN